MHVVDFSLVFDDGAVELLLLRTKLQLQLPVFFLLPPHVCIISTATATTSDLLSVHDLCQLVHRLIDRKKPREKRKINNVANLTQREFDLFICSKENVMVYLCFESSL